MATNRKLKAVILHETIARLRAAAAVLVALWFEALALDVLEERREDAPRVLELVGAHKIVLLAGEEVEEEALVGLWQTDILKLARAAAERTSTFVTHLVTRLHRQIEFRLLGLKAKARLFRVQLHINRLIRLHAKHELVALERARRKNVARDIFELKSPRIKSAPQTKRLFSFKPRRSCVQQILGFALRTNAGVKASALT